MIGLGIVTKPEIKIPQTTIQTQTERRYPAKAGLQTYSGF